MILHFPDSNFGALYVNSDDISMFYSAGIYTHIVMSSGDVHAVSCSVQAVVKAIQESYIHVKTVVDTPNESPYPCVKGDQNEHQSSKGQSVSSEAKGLDTDKHSCSPE